MKKIHTILLFAIAVAGCSWENEETLFPEAQLCDTVDVSYSDDIVPMLTSNCYACHSNANAPDFAFGISLENYEDVAASSRLILGAIRHEDGYPAMPRNREKLNSCQIQKFDAWYNAGSPEN